jgi:hypothetical protein
VGKCGQNPTTFLSLFKQYPGVFVTVELGILHIVNLEGGSGSRLEWQNPEAVIVQGAADEEVHLICPDKHEL